MQHEKTLPVTAFGAALGVVRQGGASSAVGGRRTFTAAVTRSAGEKDPYKLSLVQEVLDAKLAQTGQPRIVLEPTHQYVCFSPADSAQVARLEALDLITSYNPVGEEGRPIPEPDEDSQGEILPLYSVVPIGFQFPEDIPYTKIYDVYIQSLGGQDLLPVRRSSFRPTCSKMS